jgi:hypothetical protein
VRTQVVDRDRASALAQARRVRPSDVTPVQRLGAVLRDRGERTSERLVDEPRAGRRGRAVRRVHAARAGIGEEQVDLIAVRLGEAGDDRDALERERGRPGERVPPPESAADRVRGGPSGDRPGDRNARRAAGRHRRVAGPHGRRVERAGRGARRVDRHDAPVGRLHQREQISADSAHLRIGHRERGRRGERGVDRVPSGGERLDRRRRRLDVRRGDRVSPAAGREPPAAHRARTRARVEG